MMRQFLYSHAYFTFCLGGLVVLGVWLAVFPKQRKPALLSGLLCAPFGLASIWLVPSYWEPRWLWSVGRVGIEDLLFSFVFGGWVWLVAVGFRKNRVEVHIQPRRVLAGYVVFVCCGLLCWGGAYGFVRDPMAGALLAFAAGTLFHLLLRPHLWPLALSGALGFGLFYGLFLKCVFFLFPATVAAWSTTGLWSPLVLGIPWGEIAWALGYGACWPLVLAFLFQAEILPPVQPGSRAVPCPANKGGS